MRWLRSVGGVRQAFCCAGCLAVTEAIDTAGLQSFYTQREGPAASRPLDRSIERWRRIADDANAEGLVHLSGKSCEIALLIDGMTCGACVWLIERWLSRQPGIVAVSVNFATRRARVEWNAAATDLVAVLAAIEAIGYGAHPYDPARRETLARKESRLALARAAVALLAMMQVMMFAAPAYLGAADVAAEQQRLLNWASLTLTLPVILFSAVPFFRGAWRDLRNRSAGMDVPVALGLAAAFGASVVATARGTGVVYFDSVTMFVALLSIARWLEIAARHRAGAAIESAARTMPAVAERLSDWPQSSETETVAATALVRGEHILVRPGATIPADGVVVDGSGGVEEAILTGEPCPQQRGPGDAVLAGSVVRDASLIVQVQASGDATRLAAIARLAERAASERPRFCRIADRAASLFVLALLAVTVIAAAVWFSIDAPRVLAITFALLVVSCPCAMSLATPSAMTAATGALARSGIVLARPDALETLARVTHVALDKTGTLTEGQFRLVEIIPARGFSRERALSIAIALEQRSEHPIAQALRAAAVHCDAATAIDIVAGQGVEGIVDGVRWRIGRPSFVAELADRSASIVMPDTDALHTRLALGNAEGIAAHFVCADAPRRDAVALVAHLRALRITPLLLSGDRSEVAYALGRLLGIADVRGDLTPEAKCAAIAALQSQGAIVAMVGDGINDAPALAQAHVSISLASATPLAQWTADVVILRDTLIPIASAFAQGRRTLAVIRGNLAWATLYNAVAIPAAAFGFVTPLVAAIGMSTSSLAVVANALRLIRVPVKYQPSRESRSTAASSRWNLQWTS
jgi:Cu2+-exporting ATPase